jgi:hypothetical protein
MEKFKIKVNKVQIECNDPVPLPPGGSGEAEMFQQEPRGEQDDQCHGEERSEDWCSFL